MLDVRELRIDYPGFTLGPLSLRLEVGEYRVLVGPSGAGKTTLLEWIAGFRQAAAGRLRIGDRDLSDAPPRQRDLGIVYQDAALFPHLSVADNLAFPLRMRDWEPAAVDRRVRELGELLRVTQRLEAAPTSLSAGEARRVALGRALAAGQRVLLLDEPLDGLDPGLRRDLRHELALLHRRLDLTVLHITHELQEARSLATRLGVLIDGQLVQSGPPGEVFARPRDPRVARLLMATNFVAGFADPERRGIRVRDDLLLPAPVQKPGPVRGRVEGLSLGAGKLSRPGRLRVIEPGRDGGRRAIIDLGGPEDTPLLLEVELPADGGDEPEPRQQVHVDFANARWEIY